MKVLPNIFPRKTQKTNGHFVIVWQPALTFTIRNFKTSTYQMADVHDKATRSYNMSQIKGKNTKPELLIRKALFKNGFRYRLHVKLLPGRPDIVISRIKVAIFVHGCFWHGHEKCKYFKIPSTKQGWWKSKIERTKMTDGKNIEELTSRGWQVIEIWECDLKPQKIADTMKQLLKRLSSPNTSL